jgi:cystathionine gamma-synthase
MLEIPPQLVRRMVFPAGRSRPLVSPLVPSVVWSAATPDDLDRLYAEPGSGWTYGREGAPNAVALAARLDALEGAEGGSSPARAWRR